MRINVYAEELQEVKDDHGDRVTLIEKQVVASLQKHKAIQILLGDRVIHTHTKDGKDDDTPGIKFWYYTDHERGLLVKMLQRALDELAKPEARGA
jgi:hypothetical protein